MIRRISYWIFLSTLQVGFIFSQIQVTASIDVNHISKNETLGFKIVAVNADGTPNVDISPILN